jgi:hypothetical protein
MYRKHKNFLLKNYDTGFGLWVWKPYLCKVILDQLNEGDILVYADSGSEILVDSKNHLNFFINKAIKKGSLFYAMTFKEKF